MRVSEVAFAVADIETTAFSDDFTKERIEQMKFKLACIIYYDYEGNEIIDKKEVFNRQSFNTLKEFCLKLNKHSIKVYFHNLSFDIKFIEKELLKLNSECKPINTGSKIICVKYFRKKTEKSKKLSKSVELRDSLALLLTSVKLLGKNLNLPKLEVVNNDYANKEYCFRDCEIVAYSLVNMVNWTRNFFNYNLKWSKIPLTISSLAKKVFCSIYPKTFYRHDFKIYDKARKYYFGGRTEVFNFNKLVHGKVMDIVSLYPSMCVDYKLPNSYTTWFELENNRSIEQITQNHKETNQTDYIIGFECDITENQEIPLFPSRYNDKVVFMNGKKRIFMTIYEYDYLVKNDYIGNEIIIDKVVSFARSHDLSSFKDFFIPLVELKQHTKNKSERYFCKIFMNGITGKFGQKPERKSRTYYNVMEIKENQDFYYDIDLDCSYNEVKSVQRYQTTNLLVVICITNLARFTLWKQLEKLRENGFDYYYCDTDSIAVETNSLEVFNEGNALGCWNIEHDVKEYQAIDSKEYVFTPEGTEKSTIKFKGLITKHLEMSDFYEHYRSGTITRLIPKPTYCSIRKIPNESVVFLRKEKRQFYFKRLITNELKTIPLNSKNLSISSVKKHNRDIVYNRVILPNIEAIA